MIVFKGAILPLIFLTLIGIFIKDDDLIFYTFPALIFILIFWIIALIVN